MRSAIVVLALLLFSLGPAPAATQPAKPEEPAMRVALVRSNEAGCEPRCATWISAEGRITGETLAQFRRVLGRKDVGRPPVVVTSGGGDLDAAMAIGRLIRARRLDVVVGHTDIAACAAKGGDCGGGLGLPGSPSGRRGYCASACSAILAAGAGRFVPIGALVGVHQGVRIATFIRYKRTYSIRRRLVGGVPVEASRRLVSQKEIASQTRRIPFDQAYRDRIEHYFRGMGIGDAVETLAETATPASMHWMTREELNATGLATGLLPPRGVVLPAAASAAERPARLNALGHVVAGRYRDMSIDLFLAFSWERGSDQLAVAMSTLAGAGAVPPDQLAVSLWPVPEVGASLAAADGERRTTLTGVLAKAVFCKLVDDPSLKIDLAPAKDARDVMGAAISINVLSFDDMLPLLNDACTAGAVPAAH